MNAPENEETFIFENGYTLVLSKCYGIQSCRGDEPNIVRLNERKIIKTSKRILMRNANVLNELQLTIYLQPIEGKKLSEEKSHENIRSNVSWNFVKSVLSKKKSLWLFFNAFIFNCLWTHSWLLCNAKSAKKNVLLEMYWQCNFYGNFFRFEIN